MNIIIGHQGKRDGDIVLRHFSASRSETAIQLNEAYDSITITGGSMHTNVAYEMTRQIKPGFSNARELQTNVAYDNIIGLRVDAECDGISCNNNELRQSL